jgi:hypothetical protein
MSNIESRTEPETNDRFKMRPAFDWIVAQDHIRSEFFSRLLERHKSWLSCPRRWASSNPNRCGLKQFGGTEYWIVPIRGR